MNTLNVSIVTPNGEVYSSEGATMVVMDTTNGQIGVMSNHVPMVASLKIGALKVVFGDEKQDIFAVSEGFVETHKNNITVMVQTAESAADIDVARAEKALARAEERLASSDSNVDIRRAELALARAINRIKVGK